MIQQNYHGKHLTYRNYKSHPMRVLLCLPILFVLGCHSNDAVAAKRTQVSSSHNLTDASMDELYKLPYVCGNGTSETIYDTISIQAASSAGALTVHIKNTGQKDVILLSTGIHMRLSRTPFYTMQGETKVSLPLPRTLKIAAGKELHLSCPANLDSNFVHVGFVSLAVVGEKVYDLLPERKVMIQHKRDFK